MSSMQSRLLRGGLLAGAAVLAAGALAAPAGAAGTAISGGGASLQNAAQQTWLNASQAGSWARGGAFLTGASGTYTSRNSQYALDGLGDSTGSFNGTRLGFGGSDDPPTSAQLANAKNASRTDQIAFPILVAPVAVAVSIPNSITITGGTQLKVTNGLLAQVFKNASTTTWRDFLTAAIPGATLSDGGSGALATAVERQVRAAVSGTTFNFKGYLHSIDSAFVVDGANNWPNSGSNLSSANCTVNNSGGGDLAKAVAGDTDGSIGYANLADAVAAGFTNTIGSTAAANGPCGSRSTKIAYALVQNDGISTRTTSFGDPIATSRTGSKANVDPSGSWGGTVPTRYTTTATWDAAEPWNTNAAGINNYYGVLAASYLLAWNDYTTPELQTELGAGYANIGDSARNYGQYLINSTVSYAFSLDGGQNLLGDPTVAGTKYYAKLPSSVRAVAELFAKEVN